MARDAYFNVLQHLSLALNVRSGADTTEFSSELTNAHAALGTILIFCGKSQRERLAETLESLGRMTDGARPNADEISKAYEAIVTCARRDFHHGER